MNSYLVGLLRLHQSRRCLISKKNFDGECTDALKGHSRVSMFKMPPNGTEGSYQAFEGSYPRDDYRRVSTPSSTL